MKFRNLLQFIAGGCLQLDLRDGFDLEVRSNIESSKRAPEKIS